MDGMCFFYTASMEEKRGEFFLCGRVAFLGRVEDCGG